MKRQISQTTRENGWLQWHEWNECSSSEKWRLLIAAAA